MQQRTTQHDEAVVTEPEDALNQSFTKPTKLLNVHYDIRGPIFQVANRLEEEGHHILKLNIGNPAVHGIKAPEEIVRDVIHQLPLSQGYTDAKGLYSARKAVMQECQRIGIQRVNINDIYLGNGVSELIVMAMQGSLNKGDEVLIPSPDYPLWTAAVALAGGVPVHYRCDEQADWFPDISDLKKKTSSSTRGIVVINPNNPTGAVYDRSLLEEIVDWARHSNLMLFADEIYSKITYDGAEYIPLGSLSEDVLTLTFDGLSKAYRVAGFRVGWMVVSGPKDRAHSYIEGLDILASMRLCSNVPGQHAIQTALGGHQSIYEYTGPGGELHKRREFAYEMLNSIEGITCVKPKSAIYLFPRIDTTKFNILDDQKFVLDLLLQEKILVVQGTGFSYPYPDHFRVVFLPPVNELSQAIHGIERFLSHYQQ